MHEESPPLGENRRSSIHSNWSDLLLVDEEDKYQKLYESRRGPFHTLHAIPVPNTLPHPRTENVQLKMYFWSSLEMYKKDWEIGESRWLNHHIQAKFQGMWEFPHPKKKMKRVSREHLIMNPDTHLTFRMMSNVKRKFCFCICMIIYIFV